MINNKAIVGSFLAIAMLSLVNARPPLTVIVTWIEYNTLALLFGMMYVFFKNEKNKEERENNEVK